MKRKILIFALVLAFVMSSFSACGTEKQASDGETTDAYEAANSTVSEQDDNSGEDTSENAVAERSLSSVNSIQTSSNTEGEDSLSDTDADLNTAITLESTMLTVNVGSQARIYAYNSFTKRFLQTASNRINTAMEEGYTYGDFAGVRNPAFYETDERGEKHISCDRFVGWALYDMGYPQDETMRLIMWQTDDPDELCPLENYLLSQGFETIMDMEDLQAGDIVICSNPETGKYKVHTYILADHNSGELWNRYDAGIFYETGFSQPVTTSIENDMIINVSPYKNHSYKRTFDRAYRIPQADMQYTSSDPSIAEVSENGTVTGISPGKCTVTVQSTDSSLGGESSQVEIMVG